MFEILPFELNEVKVIEGGVFEGKNFVFSGYRNKEVQKQIEELGGKIGSSVSKKTTYLVVKDKNSGSSKVVKAEDIGTVTIMNIEEFEAFMSEF